MKAIIQRVRRACVEVDGKVVGCIDNGVLAYIGIAKDDGPEQAYRLIDKILTYRIFENTADADKLGKMDKSVVDVGGGLLLVSQFTLMAATDKGHRPDFASAMPPHQASVLFDRLVEYAKACHQVVQTGQFGADMQVSAINDGPINFILTV